MTKDFNYITSRGLPGGPNQEITYVTGVVSVEGYRYDSPDKNNSVNLIESGNISMSENDGSPLKKGPLLGIDNLGNKEVMIPGTNYSFPGDQVLEIPMAKSGGSVSWDWKGKSYSGTLIPSMETESNRYARTTNGKIKTLPKAQGGNEKRLLKGIDSRTATLSTYEEPSWYEKAADVLANPLTSFGYSVRGQDIPENVNVNNPERNIYDSVIDMINPFAWKQYAENANKNIEKGEYVDASFNALGAIPILPAWLKNLKGPIKNVIKPLTKTAAKAVDEIPKWSTGIPNYGNSAQGIDDALSAMKSQGKYLDEIGFNVDNVIAPNVINHGNKFGRQIAEVALPNGQSQLFYKSSGLAGKKGIGKGGTTEGLWQPYGGHATNNGTKNWFIKDSGYENFYDSNSFKAIAEKLDEIESGWDMSKQVLKSNLQYGGDNKKQDGGESTNSYTIYMNYINGLDDSETARNIFDKLNRMHYKDAKEQGMGVANYIATNVISAS